MYDDIQDCPAVPKMPKDECSVYQVKCQTPPDSCWASSVASTEEDLLRLTGTEHHPTSAYHPQSNGLTERFNQTHLPAILFAYQTKLTPFEVMYCR